MRIRDPGLLKLLRFEIDECAVCGATDGLHMHHIYRRSQGGDDVRANLLGLCFKCHDRYHFHPDQQHRLRVAAHIRDNRPDTIQYLKQKLGEGGFTEWLERHGAPG